MPVSSHGVGSIWIVHAVSIQSEHCNSNEAELGAGLQAVTFVPGLTLVVVSDFECLVSGAQCKVWTWQKAGQQAC